MNLSRLIICFALALMTTVASAQTDTTFTFQGVLNDNGTPASGLFNMEFTLFDSGHGGAIVGIPIVRGAVPVADGRFSVDLDFGGAAFEDNRWLGIDINGVPLAPRTAITHAPYAIQTRGIAVNEDATAVGIGPTAVPVGDPAAVLTVTRDTGTEFGGMAVETTGADGSPVYAYAAGGSYLAYHYVDGVTGNWHLVPDASNIALTVKPAGDVIVGEELAGNAKLEVSSNTRIVTLRTTNSSVGGLSVLGLAFGDGSTGVYGSVVSGSDAWGVWGHSASPGGEAGHFSGDVNVVGTLAKSAGSFKIDHPLDPEHKYLSHSFVESPDMMNVYNGNIVTDGEGFATVELPEWFEALNRDFRYQLTVIANGDQTAFVQAMIAQEIENNQFRIRTSAPLTKVSWQVTGIRHDPYAEANRIQVEEMKPTKLRGLYRHPELYGKTTEFREESVKSVDLLGTESSNSAEYPEEKLVEKLALTRQETKK
jgi:hypothetical protein